MIQEEGLKLMMVERGAGQKIRCRFISEWCKIDSYVDNKGMLLSEIDKIDPDVVVIDMGLYEMIGGIDALNMIRDRLDVNVWFE